MNDTKADARTRQEELGQFLTARPVADFMASMLGQLPSAVRLLDAGAGDPDHMIHFNGERFLGPYPDVMPAKS